MKRPLAPTQQNDTSKKVKKDAIAAGDNIRTKKITVTGKAPVDSFCTQKLDIAHVYEEDEDVYDVMLNQTNLQHNNNKYYVIQLLEDDATPNYSVWYRWGRVGKAGQNKLESYGSDLDLAKDAFCKKFEDKTLNDWIFRDTFQKFAGKYDLVKLDYGLRENRVVTQRKKTPPAVESVLPKSVQMLLQLICDVKNMEKIMAELKYDAKRAPLGKLTKEQIRVGYQALKNISDCINELKNSAAPAQTEPAKSKSGRAKRAPSNARSKQKLQAALLAACNEFYTRIPHDFGMRIPPLIQTEQEVKEKIELLEALNDIEYAMRIIEGDDVTQNPIDRAYKSLDCDIRPLESSNPIFTMIQDYVRLTHGSTHNWYTISVMDVFECSKPKEAQQFKDFGNRMLLWHGSRLTNWMGILGRGLLVAPPEAPVTGYMFGKGVYFADCVSKSANYTHPSAQQNVGLLALCEVSLGTPNELYKACYTAEKLPPNTHSVKGVGKLQPDSSTWKTMPDGVVVPVGKLVHPTNLDSSQCVLQFNEFVVYDPRQIRLRYVVKVKMDFQ